LFGFAKGALLCVAITFFAITLAPDTRDAVLRSRSGHYLAILIARADAVMPPEVHDIVDPYLERLEQELNGQGTPTGPGELEPPAADSPPASAPGGSVGAGPFLGDPNSSAASAPDSGIGARLAQPWSQQPAR
jgi:hypothetical protein